MTTTLRDLTTLHALPQGAQYRYDQLNRISAKVITGIQTINAKAKSSEQGSIFVETMHLQINGSKSTVGYLELDLGWSNAQMDSAVRKNFDGGDMTGWKEDK